MRCIGNYFSAKDKESLVAALKSIMVEVVSSPSLEIEAWAAGVNVTARTDTKVRLDFGELPAGIVLGTRRG